MKVVVYAICKNEAQFVDRWMDSMGEADQVVVLDTGSEDDTVERLRARGALAEVEVISPWRFDVARNRSMELVPEDAYVQIWMRYFILAGGPGWRRRGCQRRARLHTAIPGPLTRTAARGLPSGMKRPMHATAISGFIRCMRC